jgi:hypothetical protein
LFEQASPSVPIDLLLEPLGFGSVYAIDEKTFETRRLSFGHRNPQGLAYDSAIDELWLSEHGPSGGDEINRIPLGSEGLDFGWTSNTLGAPYGGFDELRASAELAKSYMESVGIEGLDRWCQWHNPETQIAPFALIGPGSGIGPSQLLVVPENSPLMQKSSGRALLMATLSDQALWVLEIAEPEFMSVARIPLGERIRDLVLGAEGSIFLAFDSGSIMKLSP